MKKEIQQSVLEKKSGMKVLLVEDNPINQIIASQMLLQLSVQITTADNGAEALELIEKESFDIILMDLQMPTLGGIEATKILREKLKNDTPVVAMTAEVTQEKRNQCFEVGMNEFISKPIERDYLFSIIDNYYCRDGNQASKSIKSEPAANISGLHLPGIDLDDAVGRLSCDYTIFSGLLDNFCQFYLNITGKLRGLIESGNSDELKREIHSLKGATANISATSLNSATKELEAALKNGRESSYDALIDQIDHKLKEVVTSSELLKSQVE